LEDTNYKSNKGSDVNVTWRVLVMLFLLSWPNSQIAVHSKRAILCQINVARNSRTYLGRHVKLPIFLPDFNKFGFFRQIFMEVPLSNFMEISPMGAAAVRAD